jgi:elongation factor Ts
MITASMVKELRDKTGAGMMDCKKALTEAGGDLETAVSELRKRGIAKAEKRGARATKEGLVFPGVEGSSAAMLELSCETDFVARNEDFQNIGKKLLDLILAGGEAAESGDPDKLLAVTCPESGRTIQDLLTGKIATIGENLGLARFTRLDASSADGVCFLTSYIHPPGKLGVLIELQVNNKDTLGQPGLKELARDLAMQVAAAGPIALSQDDVPPDVVEREKDVYRGQAAQENKPEKIWEKIVEGKLNKFFKQSCLLQQEFVKDSELTISKLLRKISGELDDTIQINRFVRYQVGEAAGSEM